MAAKAPKFTTRTSWREKLDRVKEPKIEPIPEAMRKRFGTGTMLIPKPLDVEALIRTVPTGRLITQSQMRAALAEASGADVTCPITMGIFVRIVAEAAEEERAQGKQRISPYWRVVRDDGRLIEKFPGGPEAQGERLMAEGHAVEFGKKPRVRIAQGVLVDLPPTKRTEAAQG